MRCGIDSCWFNRGDKTATAAYQPTIIIKKLTELKEIL
jgi:FMN phosphatase YigB (HAD superfamily)